MCGFAGFIYKSVTRIEDFSSRLNAMTDAISYRGPDDSGEWLDIESGIALGHRRLSILDLSVQGHQPMVSASGRYVIAFNGEIYNHIFLRKRIEDSIFNTESLIKQDVNIWRGHSDTEIMLAAIDRWGLVEALNQFNGMFSFALWDKKEKILHLARDRIGEKPLYYGWMADSFVFGSELKCIKANPGWQGSIDRGALALYLRHNYIPAPYSIYKGINKLLPGNIISIPLSAKIGEELKPREYWSLKSVAENGSNQVFKKNYKESVSELEFLLKDAVNLRMEADVPLGAFLSGGIDSSLVVALMQDQSVHPVKTFTIGFHETGYDEAKHAKAVAKHLGTDHNELYVTAKEAMSVIPNLPHIYDEPFADSSQIPTFLISKITRQHVKVALSGDGGDELFGGYNRYFWGKNIWGKVGWMPKSSRLAIASLLTKFSVEKWNTIFSSVDIFIPKWLQINMPGDKLHKISRILDCETQEAMYRGLVSFWDPASVLLNSSEPLTALTDKSQWADLKDFTEIMMFLDTISYLPDDILTKVDRATMAVSLEGRIPILDHRVVEFSWKLPLEMKIRNGQGKWALRKILNNYVPNELIERPKMGFGIPIDDWLRGPLREWAENLLDDTKLKNDGYFNSSVVRDKWNEHLSGYRNWSSIIWNILMFQAWLEENK